MCHDSEKQKYNFNLYFQGRNYVDGAYTDLQKIGTNTNGDFQVILPNNVGNGRYNVSVRTFQVIACNETSTIDQSTPFVIKVYLDNLGQVSGYNVQNQSNSQLYGVFNAQEVRYSTSPDLFGGQVNYQASYKAYTQQVSGIQNLNNGMIRIRITNEIDVPITISGQANLQAGNWFLMLDFEYLGE